MTTIATPCTRKSLATTTPMRKTMSTHLHRHRPCAHPRRPVPSCHLHGAVFFGAPSVRALRPLDAPSDARSRLSPRRTCRCLFDRHRSPEPVASRMTKPRRMRLTLLCWTYPPADASTKDSSYAQLGRSLIDLQRLVCSAGLSAYNSRCEGMRGWGCVRQQGTPRS